MVLYTKLCVRRREAAADETHAGPAPQARRLAALAPVLIPDETVLGPHSLEEITLLAVCFPLPVIIIIT